MLKYNDYFYKIHIHDFLVVYYVTLMSFPVFGN